MNDSDSTRSPATAASPCPECLGAKEYPYHADPAGVLRPYGLDSPVGTGWHDGWWWKRCWHCHGTGNDPL
jgi:hypothetical protein